MDSTEAKIDSCIFGGYNKKSADAYMSGLKLKIGILEADLESANGLKENYVRKICVLEKSCQALEENSKEQDKLIEQFKNELRIGEKVIHAHKETIQSRGDIIRRQDKLIKEQKEAADLRQERITELEEEIKSRNRQFTELEEQLESRNRQFAELEEQLRQKEQAAAESKDRIVQLENELEKQKWLYEKFFRNREEASVSKLEHFIQKSIRKKIKRKR